MDITCEADLDSRVRSPRMHSSLVATPPRLQCEVCVIVPVYNEAEHVEATLSALAHQVDQTGQPIDFARYEVILFANNCTDDSAAIARRFAERHPNFVLHVVEDTLPPAEAYIGRVRQLLMDEAYRRLLLLGRKRGVIASTDGDSRVDTHWIAATLQEIGAGADAVGGRIITDRQGRAALHPYARTCFLREVGYCSLIAELESYLDPDPDDAAPRHYQHYGASLAVTAEMYAAVGGMPAVRTPEDVAFYRALRRVGARFRHSPLVRVTTSARQTGRATAGLANQLAQWELMGQQQQPFLVEPVPAIETRFRARRRLKLLRQRVLNGYSPVTREVAQLASLLGVSRNWLMQELAQPHPIGLLVERIEQRQQQEGIWHQRWTLVRIEEAIAELRIRLHALRQPPARCLPMSR